MPNGPLSTAGWPRKLQPALTLPLSRTRTRSNGSIGLDSTMRRSRNLGGAFSKPRSVASEPSSTPDLSARERAALNRHTRRVSNSGLGVPEAIVFGGSDVCLLQLTCQAPPKESPNFDYDGDAGLASVNLLRSEEFFLYISAGQASRSQCRRAYPVAISRQ